MKFSSVEDIALFLTEIERPELIHDLTEDFIPTVEMEELFLKKRSNQFTRFKNFRRSQLAKRSWNVNRKNLLTGIKRFHKSTKGKQFHRSLARFLATRITRNESSIPMTEVVKALTSLSTHLIIELEYYHPISEDVDISILIDEAFPMIDSIKYKLLENLSINDEEERFLLDIVEESALKTVIPDYNPSL